MAKPDYEFFIRDSEHKIIGQIDQYTKLEMKKRFNNVGSFILELDASSKAADLLFLGGGFVAYRNGKTTPFFSGQVRKYDVDWNAKSEKITFSGPDDNIWLADRRAVPDPVNFDFDTYAYDVRTGIPSTIMSEFVNYNAGPSASMPRRVSNLTIGTDLVLGTSATWRARFQRLINLLNKIAQDSGGLGFQISNMEFSIYQPTDKSGKITFSAGRRNLAAYRYTLEYPEENYMWGGGGGDGTDRTILTREDSSSIVTYSRIETFYDYRGAVDDTELALNMSQKQERDASKISLSLTPVDTGAVAYQTDYDLGDKVNVEISSGLQIADIVREVLITLTKDRETILPVVGTADSRTQFPFQDTVKSLNQLKEQVSNLERI